eukprot:Gregarina_sp_Poly_1__2968@NODE_1831_length_3253_cov_6_049278_g1189_i0_p1_GENE_NODE_1831_length_3253_cov_6_049278_g1189_i0NODE_1831_length_3253_cov_6_049278_g1189_i0_p1_ORF_typecomplete_len301_score10_34PAP2/PF01569_21/1_9e03PAP2/PF01569_21/1_1e02PAP2/PF01569_21/2_5e25PAP2_3/PF14378_6/0_0014UCR_UQCRX_QCR9/PF05365_12/2_2e02UCR_UQCRX_QCR9/PF05365_12/47UCR_UQCRX_QCR9/PF05365_12/50MFS_2/PF13347_6/1_5e03MFS_2/PF13347_6/1_9e02MFS_2/PF13347_6/0_053Caveolin/PF01146_17/7_7e02Caveolin/PF01146_17/3_6e03Cave
MMRKDTSRGSLWCTVFCAMGVLGREVLWLAVLWGAVAAVMSLDPSKPPIITIPLGDWERYAKTYRGPEEIHNGLPSGPTFICALGACALLWSITMVDMKDRLGWDAVLIRRNSTLFGLGLLFSVGFALLATEALKHLICVPRPDYLSRCFALETLEEIADMATRLDRLGERIPLKCTNNSISIRELGDGLRSFPSGHSMTAVAGFTFTGMSIGKHALPTFGKQSSIYLLTLLAGSICTSRILLNKHHLTDVLVSMVCGALIACYSIVKFWLIVPSELSDERYMTERAAETSLGVTESVAV